MFEPLPQPEEFELNPELCDRDVRQTQESVECQRHHKDLELEHERLAIAQPSASHRRRAIKRGTKAFDSTRGYPGEGPSHGDTRNKKFLRKSATKVVDPTKGEQAGPTEAGAAEQECKVAPNGQNHTRKGADKRKGVRKCYNCGKPGHISQNCVSDGLSDEKLKALEGADASAAARELEDEKYGPGEDERVIRDIVAAALAEATPVKKGPTNEEKAECLRSKLREKARTSYLLKDPGDKDDVKTVLRSLIAIARAEGTHDCLDAATAVSDANEAAMRWAVGHRKELARRRACRDVGEAAPMPLFDYICAVLSDDVIVSDALIDIEAADATPLKTMRMLEALEPFSVDRRVTKPTLIAEHGDILVIFMLCVFAACEELTKRFALSLVFGSFSLPDAVSHVWSAGSSCDLHGLRHLHGWQSCGWSLVIGFQPLFSLFLICLMFSICEIRLAYPKHNSYTKTLIRTVAHMMLTLVDPTTGIILHFLWNSICVVLGFTSQLNILRRFSHAFSGSRVIADTCVHEEGHFKCAPIRDDIQVKWAEPSCEPKFAARRLFGVANYFPTVYRSCHHNEEMSMSGRVLKKLPMHTDPARTAAVIRRWKSIKSRTHLMSLLPRVWKPLPFSQWVATFPTARREAFEALRAESAVLPSKLIASSFIKREFAVKTPDSVFKDPRMIQGCPLELSMTTGPHLRKFAKATRDAMRPTQWTPEDLAAGRQVVYTCGLSADDIGDAFARAIEVVEARMEPGDRLIYIEDDQSRFDLHLGEGPFKFLDQVYRAKLPKKVASALRRGKTRGRTKNGTVYSLNYTMQSGWPDTSIGDTLVNAAMKHEIHGTGRNWVSIICGDDSVTVTTEREYQRALRNGTLEEQYAEFGMEVEVKVSFERMDVEFCSGRFFPKGDSFVLVPKVGKLLAKLGWDMVDRNASGQMAWLRGISETCRGFGKCDPLLSALSTRLDQLTGHGRTIRERYNEYKIHAGNDYASKEDVLAYYDHHYAFSSSDIDKCIEQIKTLQLGGLFDNTFIDELVCHDT